MIPNPDVYGAAETWQGAYNASGINSEEAETLKCGKIKIPNFSTGTGTYITSQLRTAVSNNKITENEPIDNTICAVGQGNKSPYKEIACHYYDEDSNTWYGPFITNIDIPVNMFPYETYSANGLQGIGGGVTNLNFEPLGSGQAQIWSENGVEIKYYNGNPLYYNANWRIAPFTRYQLKSLILQVYVNYTTNTSFPVTDAGLNEDHWVTLDDWKNSYNQYPIVGCKVRMISAYQISGDNIGYFNYVGENNPPFRSAFGLGLNHPIVHNSSGDTFLSYTTFKMLQIDSEVVIFNKCYNLGGWGKYSKCCLPMWDRFSEYCYKPSNKVVFYRIPYSDDVYEELMKAVSSLGFCFTPTAKTSFNKAFTDSDMCIPVIDENGITTGDYTRGTDNVNNDLYDADSTRDKNYDPAKPVDHNTYSNTTNFNSVTTNAALSKYYVLDKTNVEKLGDDLWTICDTLSQNDYENFDGKIKDEFLTTNPIDSIISLVRFPFNIPHIFSNTKTAVQLGKSTGTAQGYRTYNVTFAVNFAGVDIFPRFGNSFLDYSPYTKYELYVPFCGTIEINPGDILGHRLNLSLYVDLLTGSCIAYIFADSLVIGTAKGSCGLDQVLSGTQSATVNANIINGIITYNSIEESRMNQFGKMVYPTGIVKDVLDPFGRKETLNQLNLQHDKATFDLQHIATPTHKMGSPSPLLSWIQEFNARLMIYYPEGDVIQSAIPPSLKPAAIAAFGHVKGFATATPGIVNNFRLSGRAAFLSGEIVADSIPCTQSERARIRSFFAAGVYLPPIS